MNQTTGRGGASGVCPSGGPDPCLRRFPSVAGPYVLGRSIDELSSMTAYELLELTFESDKARQSVLCPVALHLQGAPLSRGQGAFAVALSLFYTTAMGIGGNEALVEAMTRCFLDHGGTIYTGCPVEPSRSTTGGRGR